MNFGPLLARAQAVAEALNITIFDMRCVKPLHTDMLTDICRQYPTLITLEDHSLAGGAGSAISEFLHTHRMCNRLVCLGIPDEWIEHATREEQLEACGLSIEQMRARILNLINE
ncbi:transketolase C-terminal domain-containing protein [Nitrincola nitratireducens]|uniref:1-deoxy-D-xylulose-5-phosphate synthase n=1 Tax=Nitrincola nitratireducens TaxID=1229521 RepID=W9V0A7_9GAMM|nr:transketolase C-terminal domain-containing protein [Nitrincola nitratireducens]EXJ10371.1 1-deoxy-D-xylulose-5-phosphate synthase [Nitrincola nitratireducens]